MKRYIFILAALLMGTVAYSQTLAPAQEDEQLLREWIKTIASDYFGGRKPMTPYEDLTVNYLAAELEKLGLEPAFDGEWFQPFQLIAVTSKPEGGKFTVKGKKWTFAKNATVKVAKDKKSKEYELVVDDSKGKT
ncbi:MAG: hypothetical protein J6W07_06100, partial [Bacteroidales bacterium]|nr:hypothetical protein [Bacteroidales bacterium]